MPYADREDELEFRRAYNAKENLWRPHIFKQDLEDKYIRALHIQKEIKAVTLSALIARYIYDGLVRDGIVSQSVNS